VTHPPPAAPLVLVADDDSDTRVILAALLPSGGYRVAVASDGPRALVRARAGGVGLVVTELYLPADGRPCLVEALKRDPTTRDLPVIVHTAYVEPNDLARALASGCDTLLRKPARAGALLAEIARLLGRLPA
jgi:CheY-like chemotaxis protein